MKKINFKIRMLVDTREKNNDHIIRYFEQQNIPYRLEKLDFGDYSCEIIRDPKENNINLFEDVALNDFYAIERKSSLEELSNNLTHDRDRFIRELKRGLFLKIVLESGSYEDIVFHKYNTQFNPKAYIASIHSIEAEYMTPTIFIPKKCMGLYIYYSCYYWARSYIEQYLLKQE